MSRRRIIEYPNPILRQKSQPVTSITPEIETLIQDLWDTLRTYPGCIGLAAPQIGESHQVAVVDVSAKEPGKSGRVLINPQIVKTSRVKFLREGCLSVQNLTANVSRWETVKISWMNEKGKNQTETLSGIEAICVQHEIDHLNGMLFIDRVLNAQTDIFRRKKYLH